MSHIHLPSRLASARAFTLIELLVVILVIAILIAVAAPSFLGQTEKARESAAKQALAVSYRVAKAEAASNEASPGHYPPVPMLVSALEESEPQYQFSAGLCTSDVSGDTEQIIVDRRSDADTLILCADGGERVIRLRAEGGAGPEIAPISGEQYQAAVLADTPVGYWRLGEASGRTAADSSGHGRHGSYSLGGVTLGVAGALSADPDRAASFAESGAGHVNLGTDAAFQLTSGTLEAWIKTGNAGPNYRGIVVKQGAYGLFLRDNVLVAYAWGDAILHDTGVNLADGQWHHVALSFVDGLANGSTIYVDGQPVLRLTYKVGGAGDLMIGSGADGTSQLFNGAVDEAAVYPTALSDARVLAHHDAGRSGVAPANLVLPTVDGVSQVGQQLTVEKGAWSPAPSSYSYEWRRCDAGGGGCTTIGSATSYTPLAADEGSRLRVAVTASNAFGATTAVSAASGTVEATSSSYRDAVLADGPAGYWRLSETSGPTAIDTSGQGRDATYNGVLTLGAAGALNSGSNYAAQLGGGYVNAGNLPAFQLTSGTVEVWIKTSDAGAGYRGIVVKQGGYGLFLKDNLLIAYGWGGSGDHATGVNLADGQWHHVAFAFRSDVVNGSTIYVDGTARLTFTYNVSSPANDALVVGAGHSGGGQAFNGVVDEPAAYSRALSAAEINAHHAAR